MEITIEHSGDGTLVHGTTRDDREAITALKAAGFKWSGRLGSWFLPRAWGEPTRMLRVRQVKAALGERVSVEQGELAKTGTAEEWAEERKERSLARAERLDARSERRAVESDALHNRSNALVEHIPFGQPILVGHHSQRRHERTLERSRNLMSKAVETAREAEEAARQAEAARTTAESIANPLTAARRLERNEAELRKFQRSLHGTGKEIYGTDRPATGQYAERLTALIADLEKRIEHDKRIVAESGRASFGRDTVKAGDRVLIRGRWDTVLKANPKTVKVQPDHINFWLSYPWHEVQGHKPQKEENQ